ncbi:MAG: prepilin-type N-terminal cleavage/methylation domain-containing protein [Eubacteriales bacterium]|nr:prepilin-type N-terminal cleavage/methylation domain-containing protein [Eubacteriales bacterium]
MIQYLKQNKKGLTLLELIIGLAILTIVLTMVFSFFDFGNKTVLVGFSQNKAQADLRVASDFVKNTVRYATEVELSSPASVSIAQGDTFDYIYFSDASGTIEYSGYNSGNTRITKTLGTGILPSSTFWVEKNGEAQIIGINLYAQDTTQKFDLLTSFELPNVKIKGNVIEGLTDATMIQFKVDKTLIIPASSSGATSGSTSGSSEATTTGETTTSPPTSQLTFTVDVEIQTSAKYNTGYVYRVTLGPYVRVTTQDKAPYSVTIIDAWGGPYNFKLERKKKNEDDSKYENVPVTKTNYDVLVDDIKIDVMDS